MKNLLDNSKPWVLPAVVAVLTFAFHLVYGVWFWTAAPTNATKTSINLSGEVYLTTYQNWNTDHEADAALYNRTALEVLRTGVPRTRSGLFFEHAPVYSYFLAFCYKLGGVRLLAMAVPQAVLDALTCFLVALTAIQLAPRHAALAGTTAALLIFINIRLAAFVGYPNPTILLLFLFAFAIWSVAATPEPGLKPVFFAVMILAVYTQAAFFVIAFAAVAWAAYLFWRQRSVKVLVGALCLVFLALVKPLISLALDRTHETSYSEVPTAVLWEANNPYYESMTVFSLWERRPGNPRSGWQATDKDKQRFEDYLRRANGKGTKAALLWMRENPVHYLELCIVRLKAVLGPYTGEMSPLNCKISTVLWLLTFPAGGFALWKYRRFRFALLAGCIILFEVSFESLVIAGWQPRYRLPIDLMLTAGAGVFYAELAGRFLSRFSSQPKSV